MPPKRITAEEKAEAMYQLIHASGEFFSIKELEKLGPKRGIQQQMVKEIVDSLVDDGKVEREKIGSANYYWSFPSQTSHVVQTAFDRSASAVSDAEAKLTTTQASLSVAYENRTASSERTAQLKSLEAMNSESQSLEAELERMAALDPATVKHKLSQVRLARTSATGHTENLGIMIKFAQNWLGVDQASARQLLNLTPDWEELEELLDVLTLDQIKGPSH